MNYRFREQGNDWGTATMISVCFIVCSPSIPACVNHECTARDYSLKINKTISEAEVKPGSKITFTLLVENMGPNKVYGVHVVDYLLQGFNYVDGSLNVYYCNETDNVTGECINYEECQHSGTVEYDCLSDDTSYFWFDAFAVGNNTPILGEFQYINGGYAYDNIENNTLLWTERYMIRFNVSVGENVTLGNYTNTANVSGYHDFERNFPIDYPDDSLEGCLTHNNYNSIPKSSI